MGVDVDSDLSADAGGAVMLNTQLPWDSDRVYQLAVQFGVGARHVYGTVAAGSELVIPETEGRFPQAAIRLILGF